MAVKHGTKFTRDVTSIRTVVTRGHLDILRYYHGELGGDITFINNILVRRAAEQGQFLIVQYLVQHGAVITAEQVYNYVGQDAPLEEDVPRPEAEYYKIIRWLVDNGSPVTPKITTYLRLHAPVTTPTAGSPDHP